MRAFSLGYLTPISVAVEDASHDDLDPTTIVITATAHGLATGDRVYIAGVGGNTAANGTWTITVLDADTFELDGSTSNGAYTTGGTVYEILAIPLTTLVMGLKIKAVGGTVGIGVSRSQDRAAFEAVADGALYEVFEPNGNNKIDPSNYQIEAGGEQVHVTYWQG